MSNQSDTIILYYIYELITIVIWYFSLLYLTKIPFSYCCIRCLEINLDVCVLPILNSNNNNNNKLETLLRGLL